MTKLEQSIDTVAELTVLQNLLAESSALQVAQSRILNALTHNLSESQRVQNLIAALAVWRTDADR